MTIRDKNPAAPPQENRLPLVLDLYGRGLAIAMMLLGLRHWAVILGILREGGAQFEQMPAPLQLAVMHFAVIDLVAAVGLWQRVAWGNVVWIYAALSEVALHTIFMGKFGGDLPVVVFHLATLAA